MKTRLSLFVLTCAGLVLVPLHGSGAADAAADARDFTVSRCILRGATPPLQSRWEQEFVQRLEHRDGYRPRLVPNRDWRRVPEDGIAGRHINLVGIQFGRRVNLFAIMPGDDDEPILCAARAQALAGRKIKYFFSASPGDSQLTRNVVTDLVANFAEAYRSRPPVRTETPTRICVETWPADAATGTLDMASDHSATEEDLRKLRPLLTTAAFANGLQPIPCDENAAEDRLVLRVRRHADRFDVQGAVVGDGESAFTTEHVGATDTHLFYDCEILLNQLAYWQSDLRSFARIAPADWTPLLLHRSPAPAQGGMPEIHLMGTAGRQLFAYAPQSLVPAWTHPADPSRSRFRFDIANGTVYGVSRNRTYRFHPTRGAPELLAAPESFSATRVSAAGSDCAVGGSNTVALWRQGEQLWQQTVASSLESEILLLADLDAIAFGTGDGTLLCLDKEGGTVRWKRRLETPVTGPLYRNGDLLLGVDRQNRLIALDRRSGKQRWLRPLGDRLVRAPLRIGGKLLLAVQSNELLVVDPATGTEEQQRSWPIWMTAVERIDTADGPRVLLLDLRNRLSVLSWPDLGIRRQLRFPYPVAPAILTTESFPTAWPVPEIAPPNTAAWVLVDRKGYLYNLNPSEILQ